MTTVRDALQMALEHHQAGRLEQAEALYRQILAAQPNHPEVLYRLGLLAHQAGRHETAVTHLTQAIQGNPAVAEFYNTLGEAYRAQGRLAEAGTHYRQALALNPQFAEAAYNLGLACQQQGQWPEAVAYYRRALALRPGLTEAHINLGAILQDLGNAAEAEVHFRAALTLRPDLAEAHYNLANLLKTRSELEQAAAHYRTALELRPAYAEAHNNLGNVLREQGKLEDAAAHYRQALALRPTLAEVHHNLGMTLREQGNLDEAVAHYRQALALRPTLAEAHFSLAGALELEGKIQEALESYQRALALKPNDGIRIRIATILPVIIGSNQEIRQIRRQYGDNLAALLHEHLMLEDPVREVGRTNFNLAYHGLNDRELQVKMAQLCEQACPSLLHVADHCVPAGRARRRDKIRVGFVSSHFYNHTIAHLIRGIIAKLSRGTFAVTALCFSRQRDPVRDFIESHADQTIVLPSHLGRARHLIAAEEFDILIYPDIGMSPLTYFLAFARLAPVQCVMWGHPVTTGIRTMDYFLSSELMEPVGSEQHYSERLIRLSRLPTYYYRPTLAGSGLDFRSHLGLDKRARLYVCPQSLFKLHPDFDSCMGAILREDSHGRLILIEGALTHWTELLVRRLRNAIPDVIDRIRFLPRLRTELFYHLLAAADVVLDPFNWSGGNTSYEALAVGAPIVTLPGDFMRGRVTYACYRQMAVMDCVATSEAEYVKLAIRLARDRSYRAAVQAKLRAATDRLYESLDAVRELEQFFREFVEKPERGPGEEGRESSGG